MTPEDGGKYFTVTTHMDTPPDGSISPDEQGPPERIYSDVAPTLYWSDFRSTTLDIKCKYFGMRFAAHVLYSTCIQEENLLLTYIYHKFSNEGAGRVSK